jgi:hypothetical protein
MAHQCNLVVQTFSSSSLVVKIEALFSSIYTYYSLYLKRHLECTKLAEMIESKGLKFLRNIKTKWISMLAPFKRMFEKYETLVVKMSDDVVNNAAANTNYELLCHVETIMGLMCVLHMLEAVQSLRKLAQNKDTFIVIVF